MSKRFEDEAVWITGGGTGIGRALALEFAKRGARIAVSGRREAPLLDLVTEIQASGGAALAVRCDVTRDDEVESAVAEVLDEFGRLDVAIANAGFGVSGRIEDIAAAEWRRQFDVNVVGLGSTIRHSMPHLRQSRGRMVLMGSVAGCIASPGVGAYHASKYAVRAIGQVLSMELGGSGATCTTVQPGFVQSQVAQVDNDGNFHPEWEDRRPAMLMWPTEKAARTIVDAIHRREREFTFTGHGKAAALLGRHVPGLVHFAMTRFGGYKRQPD